MFVLLLTMTPTIGYLTVHEINEQANYVEIKLANAYVVTKTDITIYIINTQNILNVINKFSTNVDSLDNRLENLLLTELKHLTYKVKTIMPRQTPPTNRQKRRLINLIDIYMNYEKP